MNYKELALNYIKEHNISRKKFAEIIECTPSQIYSYFNGCSGHGEFYVKKFFRKLEQENNKKKYGVYLFKYEIQQLNSFIDIINASKIKVIKMREYTNYYEKSDIFRYLKKYGVITHLSNYRKTGLFTDTDEHCDITFDITKVNNMIPKICVEE